MAERNFKPVSEGEYLTFHGNCKILNDDLAKLIPQCEIISFEADRESSDFFVALHKVKKAKYKTAKIIVGRMNEADIITDVVRAGWTMFAPPRLASHHTWALLVVK